MPMMMVMAAVHKHETTSIHESRGQLRIRRLGCFADALGLVASHIREVQEVFRGQALTEARTAARTSR